MKSLPPSARIVPSTLKLMYTNIVIEISETHESYADMFNSVYTKHFPPLTSVRVWIRIKFTPGYGRRMRAMFWLWDLIADLGILAGSGATTDYILLLQPSQSIKLSSIYASEGVLFCSVFSCFEIGLLQWYQFRRSSMAYFHFSSFSHLYNGFIVLK